MKIMLKLRAANGTRPDPRTTLPLALALLGALAKLLGLPEEFIRQHVTPGSLSDGVIMGGQVDHVLNLFDSIEALIGRLARTSELLMDSERLLVTSLCDRLLSSNFRLPIAIVHDPNIPGLLHFDPQSDRILCQSSDWAELVETNISALKPMSCIAAARLTVEFEVDDVAFDFPSTSPTLFKHGVGLGRSLISTACVTGLYRVAGEIEASISGFRDGRVVRAQLADAARLEAVAFRPDYTAAVQYSETVPHLPLLPLGRGKVLIERMWDVEEQSEIPFPSR